MGTFEKVKSAALMILGWCIVMALGFYVFARVQQIEWRVETTEMRMIDGVRCVVIRGAGVDCDW